MGNVARLALPGYDALTDTDLDHFSVYSDVDNVLIKRKSTGSATIDDPSGSDPTIQTIAHNLGYIPFFTVFIYDETNDQWEILNNQYNVIEVPDAIAAADTTNLYIYNYGGHASGNIQVAWDICYDNMNDDTAPSFSPSSSALAIARPNKSADSKNPNDFIMHSDLNNLKILKQGTGSFTLPASGSYSFAHGANVQSPFKHMVYLKLPDGFTYLLGRAITYDAYEAYGYFWVEMDDTNIYIYHTGSATVDVSIAYFIFGTGNDNTIITGKDVIAISAGKKDALLATNPDDFNFHSKYNTLKYYKSGQYTDTNDTGRAISIAHNLGYVPFFIAYCKDISGNLSNAYCQVPFYWGRSTVGSPNEDIMTSVYADDTYIWLATTYQSQAIVDGFSTTVDWCYKIFKNKLGL